MLVPRGLVVGRDVPVRPVLRPIPQWVVVVGLPVMVLVAAGTVWLLLGSGAGGEQLDAIRTGSTLGIGLGGIVVLWLAVRRQRSTELDLLQKYETHQLAERIAEASDRDATARRITDLYGKAVDQLGSGQAPVRLGGLYALERLAQDNPRLRQTVVDVICAYLRMPTLTQPPRPDRPLGRRRRWPSSSGVPMPPRGTHTVQQEREVRLTAQRILEKHLKSDPDDPPATFWPDIDLDLTGASLVHLDLSDCRIRNAQFSNAMFAEDALFRDTQFVGESWFRGAEFAGEARFAGASFAEDARFGDSKFSGEARFDGALFVQGAWFQDATFTTNAWFGNVEFTGDAWFDRVAFTGGSWFRGAEFIGGAWFREARFTADAWFDNVKFTENARFDDVTFTQNARFDNTIFNGSAMFDEATFGRKSWFSGTEFAKAARFDNAMFTDTAMFNDAEFAAEAWFRDARFNTDTRFDNVKFGGGVGFGGTRFAGKSRFAGLARADVEPATARVWPDGWLLTGKPLSLDGHPGAWMSLVHDEAGQE